MTPRPARTQTYLDIAEIFALRSTCNRGKVGAVIVHDRHIIAHGYNGAPPGQPECLDVGCELLDCVCQFDCMRGPFEHADWCPTNRGCQRAIHAEENAILYAARVGVPCRGAVMYSTYEPCRQCAKMIAAAGIDAVLWSKPYRLGASDYLKELGIIVDPELITALDL